MNRKAQVVKRELRKAQAAEQSKPSRVDVLEQIRRNVKGALNQIEKLLAKEKASQN